MIPKTDFVILIIVMFLAVVLTAFFNYIIKKRNKKQLDKIFLIIFLLLILFTIDVMLQIVCVDMFGANPLIFDNFAYFCIAYLPVMFLFMALSFARTKITFSKKYLLLFVIPTLTNIILWTNDFHHLFYVKFGLSQAEIVYGPYFNIHYLYTMLLFAISLVILVKYSVKNSGFFSKQATLIILGIAIPIVTNILGFLKIVPMSAFITPITLAFTVIFFALAMFKFDLFKLTPIALQTIVDRISDSYAILNDNYEINDFNYTFSKTFNIKHPADLRGRHFASFLKSIGQTSSIKDFSKHFKKLDESKKEVEEFELYVKKLNKYFNVELTFIVVNEQFLGILVLFKEITQHINDMQSLKNNQDLLIEQERLASLGQMIGGIAHNLKTPIFSVAGGLEGLSDLIKEYDESIDDDSVTNQDMHEIAKDMNEWINKLKDHVSYMSDVITTVKGQAVNMSEAQKILFPISELFQHVNILMQHEIKEKLADLKINNNVSDDLKIKGNINSLVQVINNLISNAIEAYCENTAIKKVELYSKTDFNNIIISVKDYGPGLPENVKKKLFKEMITTKGKNGTGLGLFMSYSNIKAHFTSGLPL